jgi:hypothetical protein
MDGFRNAFYIPSSFPRLILAHKASAGKRALLGDRSVSLQKEAGQAGARHGAPTRNQTNSAPRSSARPFRGNASALWFCRATRLGSGLGMPPISRRPWPAWRKVKEGKLHESEVAGKKRRGFSYP